jgi:hypothetical protein
VPGHLIPVNSQNVTSSDWVILLEAGIIIGPSLERLRVARSTLERKIVDVWLVPRALRPDVSTIIALLGGQGQKWKLSTLAPTHATSDGSSLNPAVDRCWSWLWRAVVTDSPLHLIDGALNVADSFAQEICCVL